MINISYDILELIISGSWKKADSYLLCTENEYWSTAYLLSLKKQINSNPNEAIVYLLLRHVAEEEGWDDKMVSGVTPALFLKFISDNGYLGKQQFQMPIPKFWKEFEEVIKGIAAEESFTVIANGIESNNPVFPTESEILEVFCFSDKWNNQQYYFETKDSFHFFSWATTV